MITAHTLERIERSPQFEAVKKVITRLHQAGFEAFLAGGAVRDALLDRAIKDFDIATSAHPKDIERIFNKTLALGRDFGVMAVLEEGFQFETTTFRADGPYRDGRRPESVSFADLKTDCLRRDFTINALYYDVIRREVIDLVGGLEDLKNRQIQTVGRPDERFSEDYLRLFRAIRFAATLGFDVDNKTCLAIQKLAPQLSRVSKERVTAEFEKFLLGDFVLHGFDIAQQTNVLTFLLKTAATQDQILKTKHLLSLTAKDVSLRLLAFIYFFIPPLQRPAFFSEFRFAHNITKKVQQLQDMVSLFMNEGARRGKQLQALNQPLGLVAFDFAQNINFLEQQPDNHLHKLMQTYQQQLKSLDQPIQPWLTAQDLLALNIPQGPNFGQLLTEAFYLQLEGIFVTPDDAKHWLSKNKS